MLRRVSDWISGNNLGGTRPVSDTDKLRELSLEYSEAELHTATGALDPSRRLGAGTYGTVYRGTLRDGQEVAIKVIRIDGVQEDLSGFADEILVLSKFRHPNLVTLLGWGSGSDQRYLVYELLSGGDVAHRLARCREANGQPFSWDERLRVALGAASGLSHLHNSTPKAFHRDIKSANILLDRNGHAKMADFGLAGMAKRKGQLNLTCEQIQGTPGYACPHYLASGSFTEQTEVYAFGVVLLELLLNTSPARMAADGKIEYPIFEAVVPEKTGALERISRATYSKASWPPEVSLGIATIALGCLATDVAQRPDFIFIVRQLRHFLTDADRDKPSGAATHTSQSTRLRLSKTDGCVASHIQLRQVPTHQRALSPHFSRQKTVATTTAHMASKGKVTNVVLECLLSNTIDVSHMAQEEKCLTFGQSTGPWTIGRQVQPDFFARLVPNEGHRIFISRSHLQLSLAGAETSTGTPKYQSQVFRLRNLSPNPLVLNGRPVTQHETLFPTGSKLGFCSPGSAHPFLIFKIFTCDTDTAPAIPASPRQAPADVKRDSLSASASTSTQLSIGQRPNADIVACRPQMAQRSSCDVTDHCAGFALVCTMACDGAIDALSKASRSIVFHSAEAQKVLVGRSHQIGLFERLLGGTLGQRFLRCIARSHLEIKPVADVQMATFHITNLSDNPISAGGHTLGQGDQGVVNTGDCIEFIASADSISESKLIFLKFVVQKANDILSCTGGPSTLYKMAKETTVAANAAAQVTRSMLSEQRMAHTVCTGATDGCAVGIETRAGRVATGTCKYTGHTELSVESLPKIVDAPFYLVLCGNALLPERTTGSNGQLRLHGKEDGFIVGRNFQQQIFSEALRSGVVPYISREHFRIDRSAGGTCWVLISLSGNPVWRVRGMEKRKLMRGEAALPLSQGDAILLFTGVCGDGSSALESPGSVGMLYFLFHEVAVPQQPEAGLSVSAPQSAAPAPPPGAPDEEEDPTPPSTPPSRQRGQPLTPRSCRSLSAGISAFAQGEKEPSDKGLHFGGCVSSMPSLHREEIFLSTCAQLWKGDRVIVMDDFMSNNEVPEPVHKGWRGSVLEVDEDGDAYIDFGSGGEQWVVYGDLNKLRKRFGSEDPATHAATTFRRQPGAADVLKVPVRDVPLPVESGAQAPNLTCGTGLSAYLDPISDVDAIDAHLARVRGDAFAKSGFRFRTPGAKAF